MRQLALRITLFASGAVVALLAGCSSSNDCVSACKHWAACLGGDAGPPPTWTCPLSAACTPVEECHAACVEAASCDALTGANPAAAASLAQCRGTCGGAPPQDTGLQDQLAPWDHGPQPPDLHPPKDLYAWPDKPWPKDMYVWPDQPKPKDMFVWPDTYSGMPFGCETDDECFGLKCCKTPWGVSMCAKQCP